MLAKSFFASPCQGSRVPYDLGGIVQIDTHSAGSNTGNCPVEMKLMKRESDLSEVQNL